MDILEDFLVQPTSPNNTSSPSSLSSSLFTRCAPRDGTPLYLVSDSSQSAIDAALAAAASLDAVLPATVTLTLLASAVRQDLAILETRQGEDGEKREAAAASIAASPRLGKLDAAVSAVVQEVGRVEGAVLFELGVLADCLEFYGGVQEAKAKEGDVIHGKGQAKGIVRTLPVGPVALVLPWNFPVAVLAPKLAAAWAAGCPVVVKPSPLAARSVVRLAEYMALLDVPRAAFQVVQGGAAVGEYLVQHAQVKAVAFTGSSAVGARIHGLCAAQMKPCVLECGGKSSLLVLDAAAAEAAAGAVAMGLGFNAAQICTFPSRVLVHETARESFLAALLAALAKEDDVQPLISPEQYRKVVRYLRSALEAGGRIVSEDKHEYLLKDDEDVTSLCFPPTVLTDVPRTAAAWNEEIFGPIVMLHTFTDVADAVAMANSCDYGLAAGVFGSETDAVAVAKQLHAGTVYVNTYFGTEPSLDAEMPAGGWKLSGLGYECGVRPLCLSLSLFAARTHPCPSPQLEGMAAFQKLQSLHIQQQS